MSSDATGSEFPVRCANWVRSAASRPCATTSVPLTTVPAKRSCHQGILAAPGRAISGSQLSSSHRGASMPPANQEHAGAPSRALRSRTSTATPRSASSSAQVRPATPAPMTVTRTASALLRSRRGHVQLAPTGTESRGHVAHALGAGLRTHLVRDAHGAELRSAHRAEMRHLVALLRQRRIVEGAGRVRVEREVELVLPAEIEARPRQRIVARPGPGVPLGKVGSVSGDLVSDDAGLDVVAIRKSEVLLGRDVTEHGGAKPTDHGGSDGGGNVVVTGRDIGRQGT